MISIGTDIIKVSRIDTLIKNKGGKFLNKVFTDNEIKYCNSNENPAQHFSGKFSAKESVKKALLSKKITDFISLKDIEISNNQDKSPCVLIHKTLKDNFNYHISISHDGNYAVAFALIEK